MLIWNLHQPLWAPSSDGTGGTDTESEDENLETEEETTDAEEEFANEYEAKLAKEHPELLADYRAHTANLLSALEKERKEAKEGKAAKKRLKAFQEKDEEAARKGRTDLENALNDNKTLTTRAETAEAELARLKKERVVLDIAGTLKFKNPSMAVKLIDMGSLEVGEDGTLDEKEVTSALTKLIKENDFLVEKPDLGPGNDDADETKRNLDKDPKKKKKYKESQPKLAI